MSDIDKSEAERLANVASHFSGTPELPWMVVAGAITQVNKHLVATASSVLSEFSLTMTRFEVLALLDQEPGRMSVLDLKRRTLIHPPSMTYTIDWLVERELVTREHDTVDRRSIIVHMTEHGREVVAKAHAALREVNYGLPWVDRDTAIESSEVLVKLLSAKSADAG